MLISVVTVASASIVVVGMTAPQCQVPYISYSV
jgi:hypothetical protein